MPRQIQGSQRDFSFGEIDLALKRSDDHPARKAGLRQMSNARILNSGAVQNRSGRVALYPVTNGGKRTERFDISAGNTFDIQFAAGRVKIIDDAGATVANFITQGNGAALPWASVSDIRSIVYVLMNKDIYITFAGMHPQVISWDGVSTWTIADYAESITAGGQKRTPFYRISPQNITMLPSATRGAITVQFSSPIVVAGMVGTRMRFAGRQILLGAVIDTSNINATVIEALPHAVGLTIGSVNGTFPVGDELIGLTSGAKGIVTTSPTTQVLFTSPGGAVFAVGDAITDTTSGATGTVTAVTGGFPGGADSVYTVNLTSGVAFGDGHTITGTAGSRTIVTSSGVTLIVQMLIVGGLSIDFVADEIIAGPSGTAITAAPSVGNPRAISIWDEEVMNSFRGYPASCFVDQWRLGFCDFPAVPGGICWSAINSPNDLYVGPNPIDAMFEIAPDKVRVLYVVAGPESSEFVFCDRRVYYIPISETNPLKPGSVAFKILSGDGSAQVQPRVSQETIVYANAGQSSVMAIIASGAFLRPFNTKNLSDFHGHLFSDITAIAVPNADGSFNERYAYVLNGDGSIVVGKYNPESLQSNLPVIGWGPWSGVGVVNWVSAWGADVLFTSDYFGADIVERLGDGQYVDCALAVNALPSAFTPPGGKGPLWFIPGQTVTLIDQGTRFMGTYAIDADGFIVPQFSGGEDLTRASLIAGQPWTMTVEPFAPDAQSGADMHQRMMKRRVSNFAAYVVNSTGFTFQKLFSRKETSTSPALGTPVAIKRVPAWNFGDDATLPPKQRETMESWRPSGHSFDPRVAIIKDTPGPLQIVEIGMEVTL